MEAKSFRAEECHPVGRLGQILLDPKKTSFAREIWGKGGGRFTFAQIVKGVHMADGNWSGYGGGYNGGYGGGYAGGYGGAGSGGD